MSLPPRRTGSWSDEIAAAVETQFDCLVEVLTSTTGNPPVITILLGPVPGRFQHLREPIDSSTATAWGTKRAAHVQIAMPAVNIPKGAILKITGGRDPQVPKMRWVVQSAVNSSHAAVRTIKVISDAVVVS